MAPIYVRSRESTIEIEQALAQIHLPPGCAEYQGRAFDFGSTGGLLAIVLSRAKEATLSRNCYGFISKLMVMLMDISHPHGAIFAGKG